MNPDYNEDQSRLLATHPAQPVQPAPASGGFGDYVRNHKLLILIIIIVLALLVWWFCFRKPKNSLGVNVNKTTSFNKIRGPGGSSDLGKLF